MTAEKIRVLSCYFGVIVVLRVFLRSSFNETFCDTSTAWRSGLMMMCVYFEENYQSLTLRRPSFDDLVVPSD